MQGDIRHLEIKPYYHVIILVFLDLETCMLVNGTQISYNYLHILKVHKTNISTTY